MSKAPPKEIRRTEGPSYIREWACSNALLRQFIGAVGKPRGKNEKWGPLGTELAVSACRSVGEGHSRDPQTKLTNA